MKERNGRGQFRATETLNYKKKLQNHFGDFEKTTEEAFMEAALEKYDFTTCQRPDGSKYGSNGRCIKGSETSPASKDDKKSGSKASGGGVSSADAAKAARMKAFNDEEKRLKKMYGKKGGGTKDLTTKDVMRAAGTQD